MTDNFGFPLMFAPSKMDLSVDPRQDFRRYAGGRWLDAAKIPAAFLQPPFYDAKADPAVNFCSMGAVIGHELTHGFDSSGRLYDAQGNVRDWWTEADAKRFLSEGAGMGLKGERGRDAPGASHQQPSAGRIPHGRTVAAREGVQRGVRHPRGRPRVARRQGPCHDRVRKDRRVARRNETSKYTLTVGVFGKSLPPLSAAKDAKVAGTASHATAKANCALPYQPDGKSCEMGVAVLNAGRNCKIDASGICYICNGQVGATATSNMRSPDRQQERPA